MTEKSSNSPAMAFILDYLQEKGDVPYAEVRAAATADGHSIYPIMYGRAKALLGMIDPDSRSKRKRSTTSSGSARLRQGRGTSVDATADELSGFLERYRELEEERNRYRAALLSVEKMLRSALKASE